MNLDSFDFNIDNYSINDLENFLNLENGYSEDDIISKVNQFSNKISKIQDEEFQNKLKSFIEKVRHALTSTDYKNKIINAGSTFIIEDENKGSLTNYVQQVFPTEIAKGVITQIRKKAILTTFCINTQFRNLKSISSSDCIFELPYTIKNVLSILVTSMEIPQSIYLFSEFNNSNSIYFKEYVDDTVNERLVIFPQGNYLAISVSSLPDIVTMMNKAINTQLNSGNRFLVSIDAATNKITITNSTYIFEMYILFAGTNRHFHRTMGYTLGFRSPEYHNQLSYTTESIFNNTPSEYLYLEINDFNIPQSASKVFGLFTDSFLDKNIIAKIDYTYSNNYMLFNTIPLSRQYVLSGLREYYGPTNLQRLYIRLLNKYGEVVDLNGLDFSFTLELKVLNDL